MINQTIKTLSDYLKYDGIQVDDNDVAKILDMYMRITIVLTTGNDIQTGLNLMYSGKNHLDFSAIDEEGIKSIQNYLIIVNDTVAKHKFSEATMNSLIKGNNIVLALKSAHLFMSTIMSIEAEFYYRIQESKNYSGLELYTFLANNNEDDTYISISSYLVPDESREKEWTISYGFTSTSISNEIPNEILFI